MLDVYNNSGGPSRQRTTHNPAHFVFEIWQVVESECVSPLADRQAEQAGLIARVTRSLNRHATYLRAVGERLTSLYRHLAIEVELDRRTSTEINDESGG